MAIHKNPLAKRLKEARMAFGISQRNLGAAAGMDPLSAGPRVTQYETAKHSPDFLTLAHIGSVLRYPVAFFYAEDDALAELITLFHKMNKENKKELLNIARNL